MIEDNEDYPLKSATQVYDAMSRYFKGHYQVGLLHGNMKEEEKRQVMNDFHDRKIQILVSTTVVEVGIDVKNANMMIIYDAERFGLSSIHQLRGRVGRGGEQSYCYLLSNATNKEAIDRLQFMENHTDGYEISQYDLEIRGPGEVLGQRQSGVNQFVLGDAIKDFDLLRMARNDAIEMIESYYKYNEYSEYLSVIKQIIKTGNEYVD
jgi:ATP-dependent DNA helicase RecG